jgi:hypothetical protein
MRSSKRSASKKDGVENNNYLQCIFNPHINSNIEFNLFDYELFRPVKEWKALLNYKLFKRIPKDIAISTNGKYLLLNETVDPYLPNSSFCRVEDAEINTLAWQMNLIKEHYKQGGFTDVYFSFIPNTVSIVDGDRNGYNHKLERIQGNYFLEANYLDIYHLFKKSQQRLYRRDDSHWNGNGLQLWVNKVNEKLTYP